jgi:formiminotetrahydrofolate cyclodeaminase
MAATLAQARSAAGADAGELASAIAHLRALHERLLALADDDSVAYGSVLAAYRRPKTTTEERAARAAAIQQAMQAATDVPLGMMQSCGQVLSEAVVVAERVPASARIDLAIGVELMDAALRGCGMCVDANAGVLTTAEIRGRLTLERARVHAEATGHLEAIRAMLFRS